MSNTTYQGKVINGTIHLAADVQLPENSRVLVILQNDKEVPVPRVSSPRLVHSEQVRDFDMEVGEASDASL